MAQRAGNNLYTKYHMKQSSITNGRRVEKQNKIMSSLLSELPVANAMITVAQYLHNQQTHSMNKMGIYQLSCKIYNENQHFPNIL